MMAETHFCSNTEVHQTLFIPYLPLPVGKYGS